MDKEKLPSEYQYGFRDDDISVYKTKKGLSEAVVVDISKQKGEPDWMLQFRLKALKIFLDKPLPSFGPDLSFLNFDSFTYFNRPSPGEKTRWEDVPETIKNTFDKLGIPEAEQKYLSGVTAQYESEA
ncbi:MAG: Fe-S cluster assembly protein SufB, partial [Bacilli bacterium]